MTIDIYIILLTFLFLHFFLPLRLNTTSQVLKKQAENNSINVKSTIGAPVRGNDFQQYGNNMHKSV